MWCLGQWTRVSSKLKQGDSIRSERIRPVDGVVGSKDEQAPTLPISGDPNNTVLTREHVDGSIGSHPDSNCVHRSRSRMPGRVARRRASAPRGDWGILLMKTAHRLHGVP